VAVYGLIADDLTGALDAGAPFVRAGLRASLPLSGDPAEVPEADVVLLNTESREAPDPGRAAEAARAAAERLRARGIARVYKKIDSVLRGHPGPELGAVLDVYGGRAVVAPAFPAQGRTTTGGAQRLHGHPVERFGGRLDLALGETIERCDVFDALSDADLAGIARRVAGDPAYRVWCGTAGFAAHVVEALGLRPGAGRRAEREAAGRVLVVAGSLHPATIGQVAGLAGAGWAHLVLDLEEEADPGEGEGPGTALGGALAGGGPAVLSFRHEGLDPERVARLTDRLTGRPGAVAGVLRPLVAAVLEAGLGPGLGLVLTGGETALHVARGLGARSIEVTGEVSPGVPLGVLRLPGRDVPVVTKSGGFGGPDALLEAAARLRRP
jgi:4-hydroxythreonine-4-phosphate dehydrogenase